MRHFKDKANAATDLRSNPEDNHCVSLYRKSMIGLAAGRCCVYHLVKKLQLKQQCYVLNISF
jgi:hypothetical protein